VVLRNTEEVFIVGAADVACLDDDDRRSAAAWSGEGGPGGPMAEAAATAASVGDRCESLGAAADNRRTAGRVARRQQTSGGGGSSSGNEGCEREGSDDLSVRAASTGVATRGALR
jgi:hypothetical protein